MQFILNISKSFAPILVVLIALMGFIFYLEDLAEQYSQKAQIVQVASDIHHISEAVDSEDDVITRSEFYREFEKDSTFLTALHWYKQRNYKESIHILNQLLNTYIDHPYLKFYIGLSYYRLDQYSEADYYFEQVIQKLPNFPSVYVYHALVQRKRFNFQEAILLLEKAIEILPDYAFALYHLGITMNKINELDSALKILSKALEVSPTRFKAYVHNELGKTYLKMGKKNKAKNAFFNAIKYKPKYIEARMNMVDVYENDPNAYEQQEKILKDILALNKKHAPAYYRLGMLMYEQNDFQGALTQFTLSQLYDPLYSKARAGLALLDLEKGQIESAETIFQNLLKSDSLQPENHFHLAKVRARKQNYQAALRSYKKAIYYSNGFYPSAWLNMGIIYNKLHKNDSTVFCYRKAIENDPENTIAYFNLGLLYYK